MIENVKLVHIMLCATFRAGLGYQDNIMPIKHKSLGYDVSIIVKDYINEKAYRVNPSSFTDINCINVHVLEPNNTFLRKMPKLRTIPNLYCRQVKGLYAKLEELSPDIIFVHGIMSVDHYDVARYVKNHPEVRLYVDNHNDWYNTKDNIGLHFGRGRNAGKELAKYARIMWGVSPWRVKYLHQVWGVPEEKISLLVMGGDEKYIDFIREPEIRKSVRGRYGIPEDAFLLVTGGKIDEPKNIHLLASAVKRMPENVYLLIFGKVMPDMAGRLDTSDDRIRMVGWIRQEESYGLFLASDLAVFPGTHSVLWEQACACGLPGVFKDWDGGFSHVDVGGNCVLLRDISEDIIYDCLSRIVSDAEIYHNMKSVARSKAVKEFSYIEIAKRAVEYEKFEGK